MGTFLVAATAIGIDVMYYTQGNIDYASRWLARGLGTAAVVYAFSETSGAHADPVVTLGFLLRRVFPVSMGLAYIAAQFFGGFLAAAMWLALVGQSSLGLGASHPGPNFTPAQALAAEIVATFAFVLVILMTAQEEPVVGPQAALAVGFTVAVCGFVAGPISGASMNPARTLAPQILAHAFSNIWIYLIGPTLGAGLAVAAHSLIAGPPSRGERKSARGKKSGS